MTIMAVDEKMAKFLAERKQVIGGSDVAAILGLNPYRSSLHVWRQKVGLADDDAVGFKEQLWWGVRLEPLLLDRYQMILESGYPDLSVVLHRDLIISKDYDFLGGHVDALIYKDGKPYGVFEAKTTDTSMRKQWGLAGTDEVPEHALLQVQFYLYITGLDVGHVMVKFGNRECAVYVVQRNNALLATVIPRLVAFWNNYVVAQVPPPADDSAAYGDALKLLYPADSGERLVVGDDHEMTLLAEQLRDVNQQIGDLDTVEQGIRNRIQAFMAEAPELSGPGYKFTWRRGKDRVDIDWKAIVADMIHDLNIPSDQASAIIQAHTIVKPGVRAFRPNFRKEK